MFKYIEIKLAKCTGNTNCKTTSQIDAGIQKSEFNFVFLNKYFQTEDYVEPIKTYMDDSFYFKVIPKDMKTIDIYV